MNTRSVVLTCLLLHWLLLSGCRHSQDTEPVKGDFYRFFAESIADSLSKRGVGFGFVIFDKGELKRWGSSGLKSRSIDPEGQKNFMEDTKLHIASMTKTITAIAFLKLAAEKGLRTTDKIAPYLPPSWQKGQNIDQITFRDLMTHRSGIIGLSNDCRNGSFSENRYLGLKALIERGVEVKNRGIYCYQNANFGLFRLLIPALAGYIFSENNADDDIRTQEFFHRYVQENVLSKVGISHALATQPIGDPTYTYDFPFSGRKGWNSGDFAATLGGYGWYLTAREAGSLYANILSTSSESVLPNAWKDTLLTRGLGCFKASGTEGIISYHDGWWYLNSGEGYQGLRTSWIKFPRDITVVLLVNALNRQNGLFPSSDGVDIIAYLLQAYDQAQQRSKGRRPVSNWVIEYPEPH